MGLESGVFSQENGGVRQSEAVDGLLHVSHGEQILPFSGNRPKNVVLHLVGILIFVHQNLSVAGGDLSAQLRGLAVLFRQQREGQMLLIRKIRPVQPQLFRAVAA